MIPRNRSLSLPYQACLACSSTTLTAYTFKNSGHKLQYSNNSNFFKATIETIAYPYVYPSTEHVSATCFYAVAQVPISLLEFSQHPGDFYLSQPTYLANSFMLPVNELELTSCVYNTLKTH